MNPAGGGSGGENGVCLVRHTDLCQSAAMAAPYHQCRPCTPDIRTVGRRIASATARGLLLTRRASQGGGPCGGLSFAIPCGVFARRSSTFGLGNGASRAPEQARPDIYDLGRRVQITGWCLGVQAYAGIHAAPSGGVLHWLHEPPTRTVQVDHETELQAHQAGRDARSEIVACPP
ncbi:hypothetical protein GCM10020219_045190 [Nonomuraea dietziae]